MRWTQTLIPTLREVPREAEATSHKLMLRAALIRKLSSGIYDYLPLGFRVLSKVSEIIRDEMYKAGADELLLPALHPAEIWKRTGRYESLGEDKLAFKNRSGQEFVLGPTHEEVITELVSAYIRSYKELPLTLFQIQSKFRDELRPRFGVIRSKEFLMKDAYSFDRDEKGLEASYKKMYEAYKNIFARCGISFEVVNADPGLMGGNVSNEFMARCEFGEDVIVQCPKCGLTSSMDIAERAKPESREKPKGKARLEEFLTPNLKSVTDLTEGFKIKSDQLVKTIIYMGDGKPIGAMVRGDCEVNEGKLRKLAGVENLVQANAKEIEEITDAPLGFSGPVGLKGVRLIMDYDILSMSDFVTGGNKKDTHLKGVNYERDFKADIVGDIRFVKEGDKCPQCGGGVKLITAMELGHIFKLGTKYTKALGATYLDEHSESKEIIMGCYGIGVNRIIACAIEEHHDDKGIIWPVSIAPYQVIVITLNESHDESKNVAIKLHDDLVKKGIDVLYDDRNERAGVKFNDADLIGIPLQVVVSERNLKEGKIELTIRKTKSTTLAPKSEAIKEITKIISSLS